MSDATPAVETNTTPDPLILAGDHTDDDAQVLDSLVSEEPWPPTPAELPTGPARELTRPRSLSRMITASYVLRASSNAVQLLPPDPDRLSLTIMVSVASTDPGTYVRISDDPGKVQMDQGAAVVYPTVIQELPHTGAVFALVPVGDAAKDYGMNITVIATTR